MSTSGDVIPVREITHVGNGSARRFSLAAMLFLADSFRLSVFNVDGQGAETEVDSSLFTIDLRGGPFPKTGEIVFGTAVGNGQKFIVRSGSGIAFDGDDVFVPDGSAGGPGGGEDNVQSDWDETDSESDAFIRNKPDLTDGGEDNVQPDWDETDTESDAYILNKPTLFSGAYDDLTGKPPIPSVPARAGAFTAADEAKLDGIESGATGDQSGSEIVSAIDTELGSTDWQTGGGDGDGTDQTARDAAAAAQAEADRNEISIGELQHLARDLHTEVEPGMWETADDGVLIASTPDTSGYDSTAFGSATAMVTNTAASNSNTPVSVSIRLPAGADASQYRLVNELELVTPGNSWTNRNLGVSPADSSHDYYKRVFVLGEREVSYDWTLQKRSADIDYTHYDGEFRGTFKDGIIDRDALDAQLQADIDAATPLTEDAVLDLVKESRSSADRGKFLGVSADDENEIAFLDAPSGGGSGSTSGPIRWPGLADSFIDWPM